VAGATGVVAGATGAAVCSTDVFDFLGIFLCTVSILNDVVCIHNIRR
jgi:hypothetical protein